MPYKNKRKTIVFFNGYYSPHIGGVERYVSKLAQELVGRNYSVIVVTSKHDESIADYEEIDGLHIYRLPISKLVRSRYPIPRIMDRRYKETIKKIELLKPSAVVLNTRFHLTSLVGAIFAKKHGIKSILIEHGSSHYSVGYKMLDKMGKLYEHLLTLYIKRYVKDFYGVSKESCKWLEHYNIKAKGTLCNAVDIRDTLRAKAIYKENQDNIVITFAGRLLFEKGLREFIKAVKSLNSDSKYRVLIAGDGPLLHEVNEFVVRYKKAKYLGRLTSAEMMSLYKSTDIFVHPSWTEGMPTAVLESAMFGNSIIATPVGGTVEIIKDEHTGMLVPIKSPKILKEAIELQLKDKELRNYLGKNARKHVSKNFTWDKTTDNLLKALNI